MISKSRLWTVMEHQSKCSPGTALWRITQAFGTYTMLSARRGMADVADGANGHCSHKPSSVPDALNDTLTELGLVSRHLYFNNE